MLIGIHHHILDNYYQHILLGIDLSKYYPDSFGSSFHKKTDNLFDKSFGNYAHK